MNLLMQLIGYWLRLPAELKGMRFGKNSFIGPGYDWLFVQLKGISTGKQVLIGQNAWLQTLQDGKIYIGDNTNIGRNAVISAIDEISIGKNCLISYNVSLFDHDHNTNQAESPMESGLSQAKKTIIGDNCFIGAHSFILKGVSLGKNCVVGANSVVTQPFPDYSLIAGSPAKLIRSLNTES